MWSTGRRNEIIPVFLPGEPHGQYEKAKRYDTGRCALRSECIQYAIGEEQRAITNNSRKNEVAGPMQKQCSAVDISGGESKKSDAVKNNIAQEPVMLDL